MLSDVFKPKAFAGLFAAAPSVALVSLGLTAAMMGAQKATINATSMIAGGVGLLAFCAVAALLEKRTGAITGSAIAWLSWLLVAGSVFWLFVQ